MRGFERFKVFGSVFKIGIFFLGLSFFRGNILKSWKECRVGVVGFFL